jgi:hypothetical protein
MPQISVTASSMVARAISLADLVNSTFISYDDKMNSMNEAWKDVYNFLTERNDDYFFTLTTLTMTQAVLNAPLNTNEWLIALPADFYKLRILDYNYSGTWQPMMKFALDRRNNYNTIMQYRFQGQNLWVVGGPYNGGSPQLRIGYYPPPNQLYFPNQTQFFTKNSALSDADLSVVIDPFYVPGSIQSALPQTTSQSTISANGMLYCLPGVGINYVSNNSNINTNVLSTTDTITLVKYYKGYIYWIQNGDVWGSAFDPQSPSNVSSVNLTNTKLESWVDIGQTQGTFTAVGGSSFFATTTAPAGIWFSVAYGNGLWVAVADTTSTTAGIATSPDGVTWTFRTTPAPAGGWRSVAYGNGLWVAVASTASTTAGIATSSDGITWTFRTTTAPADIWFSVAYGNGLWVAMALTISTTAGIATSPDGITWTFRPTTAPAGNWISVAYGNGLRVAVADTTSTSAGIATSPDGITWTFRTTPAPSGGWRSVAYGNGLWVAVAYTTSTTAGIATSPDGITWTFRTTTAPAGPWRVVSYGNGLWTVLADTTSSTSGVATSPDGINWNFRTTPALLSGWRSSAYGNGLRVAASGTISTTSGLLVMGDGSVRSGVVNGLSGWSMSNVTSPLTPPALCVSYGICQGFQFWVSVSQVLSLNGVTLISGVTRATSDGTYLYYQVGLNLYRGVLSFVNATPVMTYELLAGDIKSFNGNSQNDYIGAAQSEGLNLVAVSDTPDYLVSYPNNLAPEMIAYQMAIDFKRKQGNKEGMVELSARLKEIQDRFINDVAMRDDYKPERINPAGSGRANLPGLPGGY